MIDLIEFVIAAAVPSKFDAAQERKGQIVADGESYTIYLDRVKNTWSNQLMVNPDKVHRLEVDFSSRQIWVSTQPRQT